MARYFYLLLFLYVLSCSDRGSQGILPGPATKVDELNSKLKNGLGEDSLRFYRQQLLALNKEEMPDSVRAELQYVQFRYLYRLDEKDSAISSLKRATDFSDQGITSDRQALYYRALMNIYYYAGDFLNGLGTAEKMASLLSGTDYKHRALSYNYLQRVNNAMGNYDEALKANSLAKEMFAKAGDTANVMVSQISRAGIYSSQKKVYDALTTLNNLRGEIVRFSPNINYQYYGNLGAIQYGSEDYKGALFSFHKALYYAQLISPRAKKPAVINNYINLSNTYFALNELDSSDAYIDSVFVMGLDNTEYPNQKEALRMKLQLAMKRRGEVDIVIGQLDSVFKYQEKKYDERMNGELLELKESFAKEKLLEEEKRNVELENIQIQRNQYLLLTLLLATLSGVMLIVFFNRQRKFKMEKQNFLLQQRLLRSQMNPHFTFNSLNLIKSEVDKGRVLS
ncbi:MAG: histidine kinase [Bacteroidota bacterium]